MQVVSRSTQERGKAGQNRGEEWEEVGTDTNDTKNADLVRKNVNNF